jgi:hypothetical protein
MTDYLGPLTLGTTGTYRLLTRKITPAGDERTAELSIAVVGTSSDTLAAAIEALSAAGMTGNTYVHSEPGVTNPVAYLVTGMSKFEQAEEVTWPVFWQKILLTLVVTGYPAGALTTPYSAQTVQLPASVALNTLLGTRRTQLDVTVDDSSGNDFHSVWAALAPTALDDTKWLVLASALTWTTMSNGTGATYWGNANRYTTSASWQAAPLDTSKYPAGKYRLLARVAQSAGTGYVMDSQNQVAVPVTRTTPHLLVIGDLDLPAQDTAWGTAANLTLSARSDGTNTTASSCCRSRGATSRGTRTW